jgi:hypothetical protein
MGFIFYIENFATEISIHHGDEHLHDVVDDPLNVVIWINRPWHVHSDPRTLLYERKVFIEYVYE